MRITKASIVSFLLAPAFIIQADYILEICPKTEFTQMCNSEYYYRFAQFNILFGVSCFVLALLLIWRTRKVQVNSIFVNETLTSKNSKFEFD